jgi:hypothetical protein
MGFLHGAADIIRECNRTKRDYWFIDHAYFNRGYETGNFRVIKNGIHKTVVSGKPRFHVACTPWKQGGTKTVIIPPSAMIIYTFDAQGWLDEQLAALAGKEVIVKRKEDGPLAHVLKDANSLYSFASVAEVEASRAGIPVFVSEQSPCWPITGTDNNKMHIPDRKAWLGSLTNAQFHISEMASGVAWRILNGADNLQ